MHSKIMCKVVFSFYPNKKIEHLDHVLLNVSSPPAFLKKNFKHHLKVYLLTGYSFTEAKFVLCTFITLKYPFIKYQRESSPRTQKSTQ